MNATRHFARFSRLASVLCILSSVFWLSGCDQQNNPLFTSAPAQPTTVYVDSVQLPDGSLVALTPEIRELVREDKIIRAGTTVTPASDAVTVSPAAQSAVQAIRMLPVPYADVVGIGLSGVLGIWATWLNRRKRKSELVSQSLVQGIDTFRDVLDQTAVGGVLDQRLKDILATRQSELRVTDAVTSLLERYRTPDKPPHTQINAELLAALQAAGLLKANA